MTRRTPAQYDWKKTLFDETWLKKHYTPLSGRRIDYIVVHHMTVLGTDTSDNALDACYSIWQNRQASAHYGVQGEQVRQYVKWANCLAAGDTNSPLAAQYIRELGWRAGDTLAPAASRKGEEYKSFNGWSTATRVGEKIDVFAVRGSTHVTRFNQTVGKKSSDVSDHNKQYLVHELIR